MAGKLELRAHDRGIGADEGQALACGDGSRQGFAVHFGQVRLEVEEVEMAGGTGHEEVDDGLGLAWKLRGMRGQWIDSGGEGLGGEPVAE